MEELEKFTNLIFGSQKGYVYSPVKNDIWKQRFFVWPDERTELHDWILTESFSGDVYLSPVLYKERRAVKSSVKSSQVVWVEFDGERELVFPEELKPTALIQTSSSTHVHAYWRIDSSDVSTIEDINRRLTFFFGADSSGWDATQLLRPPGTFNHKYQKPIPVLLSHWYESHFPIGFFDVAPAIETPPKILTQSELLNPIPLYLKLPVALKRMLKEGTAPVGSRSSFLSKIALGLAEEGLNQQEIVSLLRYADERIRKYLGRTDEFERLSNLASFALHKVQSEDEVIAYTLDDILNHVETLDWIIPDWLHTSGFLILTSAPGVGKTQLALQLGVALISQSEFLSKRVNSAKVTSVLFLSLEMDVRQIKYVLDFQSKEWPKDLDRSRMVIVDEPGPLITYENLIDKHQPQIVVIDSLSEILDIGDDANQQAIAVTRWINKIRRRYNLAVVAIHHNRKANESNKKPKKLSDLYGSFHFGRVVETVLTLWEDVRGIELSAIKARFGAREEFLIKRNENLWFERREDASDKSGTDKQSQSGIKANLRFSDRHGNKHDG